MSFTMVYQGALFNIRAGQTNSVLVITAGPHTDQTLDGSGLEDFIRRSVDPARPVAVNVINFGADPDRATWETVAKLSGGGYRNVAMSAFPDLAGAVNTLSAPSRPPAAAGCERNVLDRCASKVGCDLFRVHRELCPMRCNTNRDAI